MKSLTGVFGRAKVALPVIHIESLNQALKQTEVARQAGADGVFLIHHGGDEVAQRLTLKAVRSENPTFWLGANYLGLSPQYVWEVLDSGVNGLWADNAGIDERSLEQDFAQRVLENKERSGWEGLYFGGVAFKYQRPVSDLEKAGEIAKAYVDVPTTSGSGTGYAADISRVERLKAGLGDHPLGIASGITPANVEEYLPYVDAFLVATGISDDFHTLNLQMTKDLVAAVHNW